MHGFLVLWTVNYYSNAQLWELVRALFEQDIERNMHIEGQNYVKSVWFLRSKRFLSKCIDFVFKSICQLVMKRLSLLYQNCKGQNITQKGERQG